MSRTNFFWGLVALFSLSTALLITPLQSIQAAQLGKKVSLASFQFTSCTADRSATPTPTLAQTDAPTLVPSPVSTGIATQAAVGEDDFIVLNIVSEESEVCYEVGEVHFGLGFDMAIGVTNSVAGQIAINRADLATSKVSDIVVNIDQLQSDSGMRDGSVRSQYLESVTYPQAKFTGIKVIGLPAVAYENGKTYTFQLAGTLQVHNVEKPVTFDVQATLKDGTLTAKATADILMTDFGIQPPNTANVVIANDQVHLVFNLIAREPSAATETPK